MLRLSKKTDYALMALKDLASCPDGTSSSAREISARYNIPVELTAKVLQRLAKRGLLASHQGTRGGYHLARPAAQISIADVIQAIDGPVMVTACSDVNETCDQYSTCNVRDPLWRLKDRIVQALAEFTVYELARSDEPDPFRLGISRRQSEPGVWVESSDQRHTGPTS
jgi:Rrf2 family protein